jgi:hypothetical protein
MKTRRKLGTLLPLVMLIIGVQTTLSAQSVNAGQNRIVGLWDVQVTNLNCDTHAPLTSFRGLHKYELGGTAQVVPATNPAALSAHVGVWRHVRHNDYQLDFKMFRFDPTGTNIGWVIVTNIVEINDHGTEYRGAGQAEFFDANGNIVAKSCPTFVGTRFAN